MKHGRRWPAQLGASVALALACAAGSCTVSDGELGRVHGAGGGTSGAGGTTGASGCGLSSPLVQVQGRPTCTGRLAASHFSNALCSCADIQLASPLATRGFDSRQGPYKDPQTTGGGASVGVNGSYLSFAAADIGGAFSIAGPADITFRGALNVRGDFWAAGNVTAIGVAVVARNAWLGGSLVGLGPFSVAGVLHHGGTVSPGVTFGSEQAGPVTVPNPCPCDPADLLDIGAIVAAARGDNDNGTLGISADDFAAVSRTHEWKLSCGRAYLTGIGGTGDLVVRVSGKSAVFIDGSINLKGSLLFDVTPGAEVDVFVKNDVVVTQSIALASKERPSAGRLWVGGSQTIVLASPWVGNLYAPHALVTAKIGLDAWGSLFAGDFSGEALANVRFDRSIIDSGAICAAPPPAAGECKQCGVCFGGNACVSGSCGACTADSDCCGLSICSNGSCVPWLEVP